MLFIDVQGLELGLGDGKEEGNANDDRQDNPGAVPREARLHLRHA